MNEKTYTVPLHELLEAIPEDIRIGIKDSDDWSAGQTWHPVGSMCHQAAAELRRLHEVNAELMEALNDLVNEIGDGFMPHKLFVDQALAALAKATGENND